MGYRYFDSNDACHTQAEVEAFACTPAAADWVGTQTPAEAVPKYSSGTAGQQPVDQAAAHTQQTGIRSS